MSPAAVEVQAHAIETVAICVAREEGVRGGQEAPVIAAEAIVKIGDASWAA